jgi:hypothetical protein
MSLTVVVQETAIRALARIRSEDKDAFAQIRRAMSALPDQPRPDAAALPATRCGSLMAAERRPVILGGRLVTLVANEH